MEQSRNCHGRNLKMIDEDYSNIDEVLNIDTTESIDLKVGENNEQITLYEAARWLALMNGIETINTHAAQLKIDLDKDKSWVKPLALQKYIEEQTPSCVAQVKTLKTENE